MSLITVTSSFASGGEKIAQKVSEQLGIEFFDDHKLQEKVVAMGFSSKDLEGFDEKTPRLFDRLFTNKPALYLEILGSVVYDVASKGEGVIVGHGAQFFLEDFHCALHVLIHASTETRSERVSKEQNMSAGAALELIQKMDKRMNEFVQYAFKRDWKDASSYDTVINLDKLGTAWAEKLLVELAGSDEVKACSLKALEEMELSSLQRKIDAAIIKNNFSTVFSGILVDVTAPGKVHLRGWIYNENEKSKIIEVVRSVPGVSEVVSDVVVVQGGY